MILIHRIGIASLALFGLLGINHLAANAETDAGAAQSVQSLRIVTLSPAISQMLVDMDLANAIVGVAQHDYAAPPNLPVVGNYIDLNIEILMVLRPTHVLTMHTRGQPPWPLRRMASEGRFRLVSYFAPLAVVEVANVLMPDPAGELTQFPPPPGLGQVLGVPEIAQQLKQRMLAKMRKIKQITAGRLRPRVLMAITTNPIMASGPGTTHDEMLTIAGGVNAAAGARVTAPTYDREGLLRLNPQLILILAPSALPLKSIEEDPRLAGLRNLPIPAVRQQRIVLMNDPLVLLPSSCIPRITADMAKAIHPDLAAQIDQLMVDITDEATTTERGE